MLDVRQLQWSNCFPLPVLLLFVVNTVTTKLRALKCTGLALLDGLITNAVT